MRYRIIRPYSHQDTYLLQVSHNAQYVTGETWTTVSIGSQGQCEAFRDVLRGVGHGYQSYEEGWL